MNYAKMILTLGPALIATLAVFLSLVVGHSRGSQGGSNSLSFQQLMNNRGKKKKQFNPKMPANNPTWDPEGMCCADPVHAFLRYKEFDWAFSKACRCTTIDEKWDRFKDWVHMNGGTINPHTKFREKEFA